MEDLVEILLPPKEADAAGGGDEGTVGEVGGETQVQIIEPTDASKNVGKQAKEKHHRRQKSRSKNKSILPSKVNERLQQAMKPLTEKCVPDKDPKIESKYKGALRVGVGVPRPSAPKEKQLRKHTSKLALKMPKQRELEEIAGLKTQKTIHKLIKYMKKSWRVRVDQRQGERELVHRTIHNVSTRKPDNWEDIVERRGQTSTETGFFSGFDVPYSSLINLELDTPMLVFNNLPPDLKISPARWQRMKAKKEELKLKRDAFLPKLPNNRIKRPNFTKGRLFKDPGGMKSVDEFLRVANRFQQLCKGSKYYAQVMSEWTKKKEDEDESANSNFGSVPSDFKYGFTALGPPGAEDGGTASLVEEEDDENPLSKGFVESMGSDERRDSSYMTDGRKFHRDMAQAEGMIGALYFIIKSILNIKVKQLNANLPLPFEVVQHLRSHSPEPKEKKAVVETAKQIVKRVRRPIRKVVLGPLTTIDAVVHLDEEEEKEEEEEEVEDEEEQDEDEPKDENYEACKKMENTIKRFSIHQGRRESVGAILERNPLHLHVEDVVGSPIHSSTRVVNEIKKMHEQMEESGHKTETANIQALMESLTENPDHVTDRLGRNVATYTRLFERHPRPKKPIWQNVEVEHYIAKYAEKSNSKDPKGLLDADPEELVEMAIRKREMLPSSRRWPDIEEIITPTFPFIQTPKKVGSEEQSRRNLLATMPRIDEEPPTPVRRLFKLAGVRTTEKQTFNAILDMKRAFRATEKKVRVFCGNEIVKMEFDTMRRYKAKLNAIYPDPIYQWTISMMRQAYKGGEEEDEDADLQRAAEGLGGIRRQALWFRKLIEDCIFNGAVRHAGCQHAIQRLVKYCDIDIKSKHNLLSRLALLVVSLPTTELGTRHWQYAIQFLLEHLFGAPKEVLMEWLAYKNLPLLI